MAVKMPKDPNKVKTLCNKKQAVVFANDDIARLPCGQRTPAKE